MPTLPVIADTFRITLNYSSFEGVTPRNVFHVGNPLLDVTALAGVLNDNWVTNMAAPLRADYNPVTFDILPLDGTTPTSNHTFLGPDDFCNGGGDPVPEAAFVLSLKTAQRGPRGRGRLFIGPASEEDIENGKAVNTARDSCQEAWSTFAANILGDGAGLVVASYVHADKHVVTGVTVDSDLGTQRRRLLQTRS
jgi:hypothetical protein